MKKIFVIASVYGILNSASAQMNTDIFLMDFKIQADTLASFSSPVNITKRKGYDNQPSFSNDGNEIYYSANYSGTNDIYMYDIKTGKNFTITNTPATSEFSPMHTPDGGGIYAVFIEQDTVTQRIWRIEIKNRKERVFSRYNDSIGYYWPIEKDWTPGEYTTNGGAIRMANVERDYAVFVLGTNDANHQLRIITPTRKFAKEKFIDDSIGRCIRQVPGDHFISYVKKTPKGNILKFYDLYTHKTFGNYNLGKDNEDYCWIGKRLYYTSGSGIAELKFNKDYTKTELNTSHDFSGFGIKNMKRIAYFNGKLVFVADDN